MAEVRVGVLFFAAALGCFAIAYVTSRQPQSLGNEELIDSMLAFGVVFFAMLVFVMQSISKTGESSI
jgi:hypothetical protein